MSSYFCRAVIVLALSSVVKAGYLLEIEVQTYINEHSHNAYGACCVGDRSSSDPSSGGGGCRGECSNAFLFCVREKGYSHSLQDCPLGSWWTRQVGGDLISFLPGQNIDNGVSNPLVATGVAWPGAVQVYVRIDNKQAGSSAELVDAIFVEVALAPNGSLPVKSYAGSYGNANMELGFRVQCLENYYGRNCTSYCARGSVLYHCTSEGIACNDGYRNPSNNCSECAPTPGCSPIGGYCTHPMECVCRPGFSGRLCDSVIHDTEPCTSLCSNGATCVNMGSADHRCVCPPGYHGNSCQDNACSPNPCLNRGKCSFSANSYVCVCPRGYTGYNCEKEQPELLSTSLQGFHADAPTSIPPTTSEVILVLFLCLSLGVVLALSVVIVIIVWRRHVRKEKAHQQRAPPPVALSVYDDVPSESCSSSWEGSVQMRHTPQGSKEEILRSATNGLYETMDLHNTMSSTMSA